MFLTRAAFAPLSLWYMATQARVLIGNRVVWQTIKDMQLQRAHTGMPTVAYRTNYRVHFDYFGVAAPVGAKVIVWDPALEQFVARR